MKKALWLPAAAFVVLLGGCMGGSEAAAKKESMRELHSTAKNAGDYELSAPSNGSGGFDATASGRELPPITEMSTASIAQEARMVIRSGEISVRVSDVRKAAKEITARVIKGGGYVANTKTNDVNGANPTVDMTIRVLSTGFDDAMLQLEEDYGVFIGSSSGSDDVTAQLVDLGARVKTLLAKEDTFREMLRASRSTNDIISLQERLTQVRTEIERMDAQRKSLAALATLSTIEVHLSENATIPVAAKDPNWFGENFAAATTSFMGIGRGLISKLTWLIIFSPIWLTPILFGFWAWRRFGKRIPPTIAG